MGFYHTMSTPASRKKPSGNKLLPVIGGFVFLSCVAAIDHHYAMLLALGMIAFAGLSMLIALARKH
jgi:hypothetical protein